MKVVTFGEIMMRLAPPGFLRFTQARSFDVIYGGGEANVAVSLANFGVPVDSNIDITLNTKDEYIIQRDTEIAGFFGSFYINFQIPQVLGLGKSVTRGFGTIKQS